VVGSINVEQPCKLIQQLLCSSSLAGIGLLFGVSSLVAQTMSPSGAAQTTSPSGASGSNQSFGFGTSSVGSSGTAFGSSFGGLSNTGQAGINASNQISNQGLSSSTGNSLLGAGTGNLAYPYYANPLYQGWPGNLGKTPGGWAVPLNQSSTFGTLGSAGSAPGGLSGFGGPGFANISNASGAAGGVRRPAYITTVVFPVRPTPSGQMQSDLRGLLARSSALARLSNVHVHVDGQAVVLKGEVADDRERRLVEGMVRLTPGVREVLNELEVREVLPQPKRVQD
jgi:BON domain